MKGSLVEILKDGVSGFGFYLNCRSMRIMISIFYVLIVAQHYEINIYIESRHGRRIYASDG